MGVPVWAYEERFDDWYADGGGPYLMLLCVLALLGSALAVALVRPCGHHFPRWVPVSAGRPVPRKLVLWPAVAGSVLLTLYSLWGTALALYFVFADRDDLVFDAWAGVGTMAVILAWAAGLVPATWSYRVRTSPKRPRTGRTSAQEKDPVEARGQRHQDGHRAERDPGQRPAAGRSLVAPHGPQVGETADERHDPDGQDEVEGEEADPGRESLRQERAADHRYARDPQRE
ncbi:hypothetical protein [Streptomyces sp. DSM 40907]|uniref:hypothetical protein n=1 Tax=Streptomyces kutzneri TaxID=3051179 RepID=UPI0028D62F94|nr:hypothetical protein [Streptomyces sp. DSM 40907]